MGEGNRRQREAELVVEVGVFAEVEGNDDVAAFAGNPAVEDEDAIGVVDVGDAEAVGAQRGQAVAEVDEVAHAAVEVAHVAVPAFEAGPVQSEVGVAGDVVGPRFVFEEFLAHEEHGKTGRGEEQSGGDAGAAAGVPGARVAAASEASDARLAAFEDFVVGFEGLHEFPGLRKARRPEGAGEGGHIHRRVGTGGGLTEGAADGVAQGVVVTGVEAGPALGRGPHDGRVDVPMLGVLQSTGMDGVTSAVDVLEEGPAGALIRVKQDAHLIVAESVRVVFLEVELRVIDEELTDFLPPQREAKPAGVAEVAEVKAVVVVALRQAVEEVEALIVEVAPCVIIDDIEDDRQAVQVRQVHQAAELVGGTFQMRGGERRVALGGEQGVDARQAGRDFSGRTFVVVLRGEVIGAVVAEAELCLEFNNGQELEGGDAEVAEVGQACNDVEELAGLLSTLRGPEGTDVKLVDDEVVELRRAPRGIVPGVTARVARKAVGIGPGGLIAEFARVGVALGTVAAGTEDVELVAGTVLEPGPESGPVTIGIAGEEVLVLGLPIAVFADEMNAQSARCPNAEGRAAAIGQKVRAHRGVRGDVGQWRGHGVTCFKGNEGRRYRTYSECVNTHPHSGPVARSRPSQLYLFLLAFQGIGVFASFLGQTSAGF